MAEILGALKQEGDINKRWFGNQPTNNLTK
jgi:hypothetical protein